MQQIDFWIQNKGNILRDSLSAPIFGAIPYRETQLIGMILTQMHRKDSSVLGQGGRNERVSKLS